MNQWWAELVKSASNPLLILGFLGQVLFFSRWIIQWYVSERKRQSIVPLAFWYCSLSGGLLLLIYAIQRHDLVFIIGQLVGLVTYLRNIMLLRKQRTHEST